MDGPYTAIGSLIATTLGTVLASSEGGSNTMKYMEYDYRQYTKQGFNVLSATVSVCLSLNL
jgi:hypothetical protein